jgi:replicative DNA helicase
MTPVWKNEDWKRRLSAHCSCVVPTLRYWMFFPGCLQAPSQFVSIGKFTLASADRPAAVVDPLLLCESLPALQTTILEATRVSWAKSALVSYVDVLRRNAGVRDAESALEKALEQIRSASNGDAALAALEAAKLAVSAIDISADTVQPVHISELLTAVADEAESRSQGKKRPEACSPALRNLMRRRAVLNHRSGVYRRASIDGQNRAGLGYYRQSIRSGHGVLFFSMEMSDIQIAKRMVSAAGGMSMSRLKAVDKFEDEDWARFFNGMERWPPAISGSPTPRD